MKKNHVVSLIVLGGMLLVLSPTDCFAIDKSAANGIDGTHITEHAEKITKFLFGPVSMFVGALGAGYGAITAMATGSPGPLMKFAGIGLSIAVIPKFLQSVFTVLLP